MAPAGGVQTREYERWDYGWRSVNMGKMSEYRVENYKVGHMYY